MESCEPCVREPTLVQVVLGSNPITETWDCFKLSFLPIFYYRFYEYNNYFFLQIESKQGLRRDDTSLNGVRLICGSKEGIPDGSYAMSTVGPFGDWKGEVRCLYGNVIASFKLQVEPPRVNITF